MSCRCHHLIQAHSLAGCGVVGCPCRSYRPAKQDHPTYDDGLADGVATCEDLVVAGLQALAEAEDAKARDSEEAYRRWRTDALRIQLAERKARAACLREMALAVSGGQFRTAEANEAAGKPSRDVPELNSAVTVAIWRAQDLDSKRRAAWEEVAALEHQLAEVQGSSPEGNIARRGAASAKAKAAASENLEYEGK